MNFDAYGKLLQFVDNFSKKSVVGGMVGDKIKELSELPGKFRELPKTIARDWETMNLPEGDPKREEYWKEFDKKGKELTMSSVPAFGLSSPVASPGLAAAIKAQSSLLLTQNELAATQMLRGGAKPQELVKKGFTMGDVVKANQRNQGLGLLADFDNASRAKNTELMKQIADAIDNMPPNSPYAPFRGKFTNTIQGQVAAQSAPQLNIGAGLQQAANSAGQKGYNAPLAGFESGLQQGMQNAQKKWLEIMGK